jgi:hypothetical protein
MPQALAKRLKLGSGLARQQNQRNAVAPQRL